MATRKQIGFVVPGFGLPLQWPPSFKPDENTMLPSVLDASEDTNDCYTVRERTMLALMNELTDMPEWERKIFDPNLTFKWKAAKTMSGKDITKAMADWCVEEVKYHVPEYVQSKIIPTIDGGVMKSDAIIPRSLHDDLRRATASLRRASRETCDAYEIFDVVDPFLYSFSWERTRTLHYEFPLSLSDCIGRSGEGELARQPAESDCPVNEKYLYANDMAFSRRFQFLPFEIAFGDKGAGGSKITSYISNIHPSKQRAFYHSLESFIDRIIPVFNRSLMTLKGPSYEKPRLRVADLCRDPMIKKDVDDFRPLEQRTIRSYVDQHGRYRDWLFVDLRKEFWNIGLQFVLHIQEITFHPNITTNENNDPQPPIDDLEWHVAGQRNERICATALYVTHTTNLLTPPQISFRRRVHPEEAMLASGYIFNPPFAPEIYGAQTGDPVIQHMGDIELRENRCVTYPNIFQTRLLPPSKLQDPSKPASVTLMSLHLIDPNRRMMSSAMVPSQRRDWWAEEVRRVNAVLWRLPAEVWDRIVEMVEGYPIGLEEAEEIRREFVEERREFQRKHTKAMEDYWWWDLDNEIDEWVHV